MRTNDPIENPLLKRLEVLEEQKTFQWKLMDKSQKKRHLQNTRDAERPKKAMRKEVDDTAAKEVAALVSHDGACWLEFKRNERFRLRQIRRMM